MSTHFPEIVPLNVFTHMNAHAKKKANMYASRQTIKTVEIKPSL